jgi:hypothetical protein
MSARGSAGNPTWSGALYFLERKETVSRLWLRYTFSVAAIVGAANRTQNSKARISISI